MPSDPSKWVGQSLTGGRYRVTGRLGAGGMARCSAPHDRNLDTDVVLKVPRPEMLLEPDFAGRFASEIRSMVKLAHPHVVKILDVGEHDKMPFGVMQFCAGGSLEDRFKKRGDGQRLAMPVSSLNDWLLPVAEALDFVHTQGYVHRDIKPGNILFDGHGNPYVSDFGIAKVIAAGANKQAPAGLTRAGAVLGTGPYMPPEMLMGETYDGRADQYALAITVYEALSGRLPYTGTTAQQVLKQQITGELIPLHRFVPTLPTALWQILGKALATEPQQRFADCAAFARTVTATLAAVPQPVGAAAAGPGHEPHAVVPRGPATGTAAGSQSGEKKTAPLVRRQPPSHAKDTLADHRTTAATSPKVATRSTSKVPAAPRGAAEDAADRRRSRCGRAGGGVGIARGADRDLRERRVPSQDEGPPGRRRRDRGQRSSRCGSATE